MKRMRLGLIVCFITAMLLSTAVYADTRVYIVEGIESEESLYHTNINCSHLFGVSFKPMGISLAQSKGRRACSDCNQTENDIEVFITENSDNSGVYHTYTDCPHLQGKEEGVDYWRTTLDDELSIGHHECSDCQDMRINSSTTLESESAVFVADDSADTTASESTKSSKSSKSSSNTNSSKASSSSSSKASSSSSSDGYKSLMTDSQRRKKFESKTNPKMGAKPATIARPDSGEYEYADFAKYNSCAEKGSKPNGLGNRKIYLMGTIMEIEKEAENGTSYRAGVFVNDADGYQWYMRAYVAKDKYDSMKAELLGKTASICGWYKGYSTVVKRPMMEIEKVFEVDGKQVDMSIYK